MSDEQDKADGGAGSADRAAARGGARPTGKRGRTDSVVTMPRPKVRQRTSGDRGGSSGTSRNPFARIMQFLREVVAEMKKVIWPTKNEWFTYTIVVLVFIVAILGMTTGLDIGFGKAVSMLFG
ncbi:MAG: preprotein translocase subunit SecE [Tomitella sp.]|nr:preprotein translocase subunit SecE [Tomitella sp.]